MAKRIQVDGKFYRVRRGALVEIPAEWVGRVTTPQTISKRRSNQVPQVRKIMQSHQTECSGIFAKKEYREKRHLPILD